MPRPSAFAQPPRPTEIDLGWLAGFFEGEGCFSVHRGRPSATVNQSYKPILVRFSQLIGVGKIYPVRTTLSKQMWVWKTNTIADAQYVAELLYPHLSARRRQQARKVLAVKPKRARLVEGGTCREGHVLTSDNIVRYPKSNSMGCKRCINDRRKKRYAERKRHG